MMLVLNPVQVLLYVGGILNNPFPLAVDLGNVLNELLVKSQIRLCRLEEVLPDRVSIDPELNPVATGITIIR